jgi:prepilin-type processing-associated H-X9-DG protein
LVELLVMVGIIGVLLALLVPMLVRAQERAGRFKCQYHLRDIGRAMVAYADANHGRYPTTRPAGVPCARPDVSNSGFDKPDPFAEDGPAPNNVPAAIFLLVRTQELKPKLFVCPNTEHLADALGGAGAKARSNFTDVGRNLSYAMQNPYADEAATKAGFKWQKDVPGNFPLMADRGPAAAGEIMANSPNHGGSGQNILFADGSVDFRMTPLAGIDGDHIYRTRDWRVLESPRDALDSILLPAAE